MKTYYSIVFLQGDDANEAFEILDNQGKDALHTYLSQWFHGDLSEHEERKEVPWGSADRLHYFEDDSEVISYNRGLSYISLTMVEADKESPKESPIEINEDNYFEIAEALHTALTLWHDGKFGYELLCRSQFKPGHSWSETTVESENEYYHEVEALMLDDQGNFKTYDLIEALLDALNEYLDRK